MSGDMTDVRPLVSILMPAYNHERFVRQAIESVFEQEYKNIELIIVDDCSPDKTAEMIEETIDNADIPVTFIRNIENLGITKTLNKALELSKGEWIALLASDDFFHKDFIETMLHSAFQENFENKAFHCDAIFVDEKGKMGHIASSLWRKPPCSGSAFLDFIYGRGSIISSTLFLRRSFYQNLGGFDETLMPEDFDFHLRLSRVAEFVFIDQPLFLVAKL